MRILLLYLALSSCSLSGGLGAHHTDLDSEFKDGSGLGFIQGELPVTKHLSFYARHESILFKSDRNIDRGGSGGVNSLGIMGRIEILK